eukprot:SAG11_NODE_301_length_11038_cov_2.312826_12_plen_196_part_00
MPIDEGLAKSQKYGDRFNEERKLCMVRRDDLIQTAKQEMSQLSATREPVIEDINICLAKYENFPDVRSERDRLRAKLSMTTSSIRDALERGARSKNVKEIDALLEQHRSKDKDAQPSALLKDAIDNLSKHRQELANDMASRMKDAAKLEASWPQPKTRVDLTCRRSFKRRLLCKLLWTHAFCRLSVCGHDCLQTT